MTSNWLLHVEEDGHVIDGTLRDGHWYLDCTCGWEGDNTDGFEEVAEHLLTVSAADSTKADGAPSP